MRKLLASLAAMLSASLTVQGCVPIEYKPLPTTRTAKVPPIAEEDRVTMAPTVKQKKRAKKPTVGVDTVPQTLVTGPRLLTPRVTQNVY